MKCADAVLMEKENFSEHPQFYNFAFVLPEKAEFPPQYLGLKPLQFHRNDRLLHSKAQTKLSSGGCH